MIWSLQAPKGGCEHADLCIPDQLDRPGHQELQGLAGRAADFTKLAESSGGRVRELLWTVGEYDLVSVVDFPDDETATAALLQVASLGSIRSNTMRAFSADEMTAIIGKTG